MPTHKLNLISQLLNKSKLQSKMKKTFFSLLLFLAATAVNAQEILKGDMNDDNAVTIADVTSLVNVILGKAPQETISVGGNPYAIDNNMVVGTWHNSWGGWITLNADGTTDYWGEGSTYKFFPSLGRLVFYYPNGIAGKVFGVIEVSKDYLLLHDCESEDHSLVYYTNHNSLITALSMSESTLTINSGSTYQLSVTATPETAFYANMNWSSSDSNVATVSRNGLVTAKSGGTCTITATATDGSGQTATCELTVVQMVTSITLSQTTAVLDLDATLRLTATALPENAANKNVTWSSSNEDVASVRNGLVVAYGYGTVIITCEAADGSGVKAMCRVHIPKKEYVDLGLPSGTLWATCNIGADTPEDYGDYFAWGETKGYNEGKTNFDWSTYKWCEGSESTMTKYCTNSSYGYEGFTDDKTELDLEDDAAYVNWGPAWRMPSKEQFDELINNNYTTTEWTTQNGVIGLKIMSKTNGNSIFLPAAGLRDGSSLNAYADVGSFGIYWSRTLSSGDDSYDAGILNIDSSYISTSNDARLYGQSVRPVRSQE